MGGTSSSSLTLRIDNARRTGACSLSDLKLKKVPEDIAKAKDILRTLDLSKNQISVLPNLIIGQLSNLKNLLVAYNQIGDVSAISSLSKLEKLDLNFNRIESIPPSISQLHNLRTVMLKNNNISVFPNALIQLQQLDVLDLSYNNVVQLPTELASFNGVELNMNSNRISSLPASMAKCPRLKVLRVENNTISIESIPTEILTNSMISLLAVEGNAFQMKQFRDCTGYDKYMERYTASKKKIG